MAKIESVSSPESTEVIRKFLKTHTSGTLVTADTAANPAGAVVYYFADDDFTLYFGTKGETQKYKNIEQNDQVAFVCYDEATQTTIQMTGRAEVIDDPDERNRVINMMYRLSEATSSSALPPAEKLYAGDYKAVRIIPKVIKLAVFARPDAEANEDLYEILAFSE